VGAQTAEGAGQGEARDHGEQKTLAAEVVREPACDREDDGIRNDVGGEHPGGLVHAGREVAGRYGGG